MKVRDFVSKFIRPNTLVRLWYNDALGNPQEIIEWDKPMMDWELIDSEYQDNEVIGVTDILYLGSSYVEAVNLVIKHKVDYGTNG